MYMEQNFMKRALELASNAANFRNEPFGALLIKNDKIVLETQNSIYKSSDPAAMLKLA